MTSAAQPAAIDSKKPVAKGTLYKVFGKRLSAPGMWKELGGVTAASSHAAIRAIAKPDLDYDELVAIPARSFQPVKITMETRTVVTLEAAG